MSSRKKLKSLISCFVMLLITVTSGAQSLSDTIRNEIIAINRAYDSAFYLTFNVKIVYNTEAAASSVDTLNVHSEMTGTYTLHGNKALYQLGDIEYMQNDSFTIAAYKENKVLLVGKPQPGQLAGGFVPTRAVVDSAMAHLDQDFFFLYLWSTPDSNRVIACKAISPDAAYEKIEIEYEVESHHLVRIKYWIKDYDTGIEDGPQLYRLATVTFQFGRYRVEDVGPSVFSELKYLFFDGPNDIRPADAFRDFTLYKSF